jgi:prepilin signal peptidase PulO-like enzyme (type II secretory pathway)
LNKSDDFLSESTNQQPSSEPASNGHALGEEDTHGVSLSAEVRNALSNDEDVQNTAVQNTAVPDLGIQNKSVHRRKKRAQKPNWYLITVAIGVLLGWAFYTFAWPPLYQSIRVFLQPNRAYFEKGLESPVRELYQTCEYLAVLWFFYLGASIGSFFNVLAGRLPEGRGVVFGGSKCPFCQTRLSFRDNIPIFGWLSCKGRCSTCKLPIAPRYLLIELLVGSLFVLIAGRELFSGGANLPNFNVLMYAGIIWTVFYPKWYLIGAFVYHAMFFATLVMLSVADQEKTRFPWRAVAFFGMVFAVIKLVRLDLNFVRWFDWLPLTSLPIGLLGNALITVVLGGVFGGIFGLFAGRLFPPYVQEKSRTHWLQVSFLTGIVFGWQAVLVTGLGAMLLTWLSVILAPVRKKYPSQLFFGILVSTILVHHMFWRQIDSIIKPLVPF